MVKLEIDGKKITIEAGASIIEAADQAGIYIPRFCYHKKLSIAANCRMCLVEVEKVGKPLPACATPVTEGMKVFTRSQKALQAQRAVMEFLLINHPLDCPICDQGGVCELQDLAMGFGSPHSIFKEEKRAVRSEDIGSLIETEMTRCINCTRCVRFGDEIAGMREIGVLGRGEKSEIGTYVKHFLHSEMSANITDICPVGALTTKPNRYACRGWEVHEHAGIAAHDCVGSNIYIQTRGHALQAQREVHNVVPRLNEAVNEMWISDRDRFGYLGLQHADRVYQPMIKKSGKWQTVEWQRALTEIADKMQAIVQQQGPAQLAAVASTNSTVEECYLLQKMMRGLGCHNIDHRTRQVDFADHDAFDPTPHSTMTIEDMDDLTGVLLVGSNIRLEQPILAQRINKAAQDGAVVMAINPKDYKFAFAVNHKMISRDVVMALAEVVKVLADKNQQEIPGLAAIVPSEQACQIATELANAEKPAIFLGAHTLMHPKASQIRALADRLAGLTGAKQVMLLSGANSVGAWVAGAVPHRGAAGVQVDAGMDAHQFLATDPVRAYLLLNTELEYDCAYSQAAMQALKQAGLVVCLTSFASEQMKEYADFILPIAPFGENTGTFVNIEGRWQSFVAGSPPHQGCKPAWKVLRVLANFLQLEGFKHKTAHQVRDELQQLISAQQEEVKLPTRHIKDIQPLGDELIRMGTWPIYRVDPLVRRSQALQEAPHDVGACVMLHPNTAAALQLKADERVCVTQQGASICLPLVLDNALAENMAFIPSGLEETAGWGGVMQAVSIKAEEKHA